MGDDLPAGEWRPLSARDVATLRAALRLWLEMPTRQIPEDVLEACHAEVRGMAFVLAEPAIEQLLAELRRAETVLVAIASAEADVRCI